MPSHDPHQQRAFALEVVEKLRAAGYQALWAGGCVRDRLLERTPKDYDVATSARPEEIRVVFGARRTVAVGAAFGVITVLGPKHAGSIEVATFREDATYSDGRRPDSVTYSTPEADAQRRDFTINGLFFDPLDNRVVDFVGGREDLDRGIIRAIGDPRARFAEDKLRLLRGVRFAASYDFVLEQATRAAIAEMAPQVTVVSVERIAAEMRLMLTNPHRAWAVTLLREVGLLAQILPELTARDAATADSQTPAGQPAATAWPLTLQVLEALSSDRFPPALAALVHAFVTADGAAEIGRRWKLSNRDLRHTRWLVEHHAALLDAHALPWPRLQRLLISDDIEDLLQLDAAIAAAAGRPAVDVAYCRKMLVLPPERLNPPPLVTGDDLVEQGIPRGKHYQRLLEALRDAQLEGKIATRQEAQLLAARLWADEAE